MALIVQKFGGTSVANVERIRLVARRVVATVQQGHRVAVVVSAMAGETDALVALANDAGGEHPRALDPIRLEERIAAADRSRGPDRGDGTGRHPSECALHSSPRKPRSGRIGRPRIGSLFEKS